MSDFEYNVLLKYIGRFLGICEMFKEPEVFGGNKSLIKVLLKIGDDFYKDNPQLKEFEDSLKEAHLTNGGKVSAKDVARVVESLKTK